MSLFVRNSDKHHEELRKESQSLRRLRHKQLREFEREYRARNNEEPLIQL